MNAKIALLVLFYVVLARAEECCDDNEVEAQDFSWGVFPTNWALQERIPMVPEYDVARKKPETRGKFKVKKKIKRFMLPLLLAYKLKFFTLIPVLIGGLILLTGATGLAGFFFALFAAVMGLKTSGH